MTCLDQPASQEIAKDRPVDRISKVRIRPVDQGTGIPGTIAAGHRNDHVHQDPHGRTSVPALFKGPDHPVHQVETFFDAPLPLPLPLIKPTKSLPPIPFQTSSQRRNGLDFPDTGYQNDGPFPPLPPHGQFHRAPRRFHQFDAGEIERGLDWSVDLAPAPADDHVAGLNARPARGVARLTPLDDGARPG